MYLFIGIFLGCFLGILFTAYWSIESIKAVSEKFKLSDTFVGAVFLSVGTSFPEFINSIVSGFHDAKAKQPLYAMYSFYNVTGANTWQVVFLVIVVSILAVVYKLRKQTKVLDEIGDIFWQDSILSWELVFWETILLSFIFFFPKVAGIFLFKGFNLLNLIFLAVWLWYLNWTYHNKSSVVVKQDRSKFFTNWNKGSLIAITLFLWILFGSLAYANFYTASLFPLDSSTSFGIALSFITSSPEFFVLCILFKQKEFRIAVGGFFGSSLFNLTLPAYTNFISTNPIMGKDISIGSDTTGTGHSINSSKMGVWLVINVILLLLFLLSFWRGRFRTLTLSLNGLLVAFIYSAFNFAFNYL